MLIHENVFLRDRLKNSLQREANLSKLIVIFLFKITRKPDSLMISGGNEVN